MRNGRLGTVGRKAGCGRVEGRGQKNESAKEWESRGDVRIATAFVFGETARSSETTHGS